MDDPARPLAAGEDLYAVLGVADDASSEAIRRGYRREARSCHPDVTASAEAAERFRRLAAAYEVLADPSARRAYDRRRGAAARLTELGRGPAPIHRAPGPSWNPAVRGPAAQAARSRPAGDPSPPRPERTSSDEWRLASTIGKALVVIAVLMLIAFGTMVVVTVTSESDPLPVPTIFCRTPDGWLDCRQAMDPR
jgi:hypothetical protein